jgi:hypothetical protein
MQFAIPATGHKEMFPLPQNECHNAFVKSVKCARIPALTHVCKIRVAGHTIEDTQSKVHPYNKTKTTHMAMAWHVKYIQNNQNKTLMSGFTPSKNGIFADNHSCIGIAQSELTQHIRLRESPLPKMPHDKHDCYTMWPAQPAP